MSVFRARVASTLAAISLVALILASKIAPFTDEAVRVIASGGDDFGRATSILTTADDAARVYSRHLFGYGTATRDEVLKLHAIGTNTATNDLGRVIRGRWRDAYTGKVITEVSNASVDHVVSLRWAWDHGAKHWPDEKLRAFGTDTSNLLVTSLKTNGTKAHAGPGEWMPAGKVEARQLLARQEWIIKKYGLEP